MKSLIHTTLLLLYFISFSSCIKKVDDTPSSTIPCFGSFSCDINGVPFETSGKVDCSSEGVSYNPEQNFLLITGADCRVENGGFRGVVFDVENVTGVGKYSVGQVNAQYLGNHIFDIVSYNQEIAGHVHITNFVEDNYSEDFTGGYAEGTFWFTAYNQDTFDTVHVTNGRFCGRF
jgi:hypothetical protein